MQRERRGNDTARQAPPCRTPARGTARRACGGCRRVRPAAKASPPMCVSFPFAEYCVPLQIKALSAERQSPAATFLTQARKNRTSFGRRGHPVADKTAQPLVSQRFLPKPHAFYNFLENNVLQPPKKGLI